MDNLKKRITEIVSGISLEEINDSSQIIDDGLIDSLDLVAIVSELNMEFDISIGVEDVVPENFNTLDAIAELVSRLLDE